MTKRRQQYLKEISAFADVKQAIHNVTTFHTGKLMEELAQDQLRRICYKYALTWKEAMKLVAMFGYK